MSDYKFVVFNVAFIMFMATWLGAMGGAEILYDDVDIGSGGTDFDTDRLVLDLDEDFIDLQTQGITWTGQTNDRNEDYGYITYDSTDRNDIVYIPFEDASFFEQNIGFFVTDESNNQQELTGGSPREIDLSGEIHGMENIVEVEIRINNIDAWVQPKNAFERNDRSAFNEITEIDIDADQSMREAISSSLQTGLNAIIQIPSLLFSWIAFMFAIPGTTGTILRGYITGFVAYFLIKEIWIG